MPETPFNSGYTDYGLQETILGDKLGIHNLIDTLMSKFSNDLSGDPYLARRRIKPDLTDYEFPLTTVEKFNKLGEELAKNGIKI